MYTHEMRAEVDSARITMRAADNVANDLASILVGRLRHVGISNLKKLKKELRDYNIHTGQWKEK